MRNRVLMPLIAVLWLCGFVMGWVWHSPPVHASGYERFPRLYFYGEYPPDVAFAVYGDRKTGQEIICTKETIYSIHCWPTATIWKDK